MNRSTVVGASRADVLDGRRDVAAAVPVPESGAAIDTVEAVLDRVLYGADGPCDPAHTPVVLAAADYCTDVATVFVRRCDQPGRTLRPFDSVLLETSELLRGYDASRGRRAPAHVVVTPDRAAGHARLLAEAMVRAGTPEVVVCEVHATAPPADPAPTRNPTGPYLVVAHVVRDGSAAAGTGLDPAREDAAVGPDEHEEAIPWVDLSP